MSKSLNERIEEEALKHHKKVNPFIADDEYFHKKEKNQTIEAFLEGYKTALSLLAEGAKNDQLPRVWISLRDMKQNMSANYPDSTPFGIGVSKGKQRPDDPNDDSTQYLSLPELLALRAQDQAEIHKMLAHIVNIERWLGMEQAHNDILKEALQFYADGNHIQSGWTDGSGHSEMIGGEDGLRARKALKETE